MDISVAGINAPDFTVERRACDVVRPAGAVEQS